MEEELNELKSSNANSLTTSNKTSNDTGVVEFKNTIEEKDKEISSIIEKQYQRAIRILKKNKKKLIRQ